MSDNAQTPHIVVDATVDGVIVPPEHVRDGKIVLNVSHQATDGLELGNDIIAFGGRFRGQAISVHVPVGAVLGIYARETGQGMLFSEEEPEPEPPKRKAKAARSAAKKTHLKVVK